MSKARWKNLVAYADTITKHYNKSQLKGPRLEDYKDNEAILWADSRMREFEQNLATAIRYIKILTADAKGDLDVKETK